MAQEQEKISRSRKKELIARLKEQIQPKMKLVYLSAFLAWLQFIMRILSFALIAKVLSDLYERIPLNFLSVLFWLFFFSSLGFTLSLLAKNFQGVASQFARNKLKAAFFQAFVDKDGEFQDSKTAADVLTVASQGIDSLDTYYSYYLPLSLRTYLNCLTVLVVVFFLFPAGGLIFILSLPLIPISVVLMQKRSRRIMNRYWASYMDVGNLFLDDLQGLNTLYSYQADAKYEKEFAAQAEDFRDATMELLGFQLQSVGYMDAVMYLGIGVSGFVAASMLQAGHLSLFAMIYFVFIATEFFTPIREAGYGMHLVMMNTKMADRIFGFLDSIEKEAKEEQQELTPFSELTVSGLDFALADRKLFEELSFKMKRGQILAIAGESGRGKTTLAKLLLGKRQVDRGSIFLGEKEIKSLSKSTIYQEVMYVSANSVLLNASILENLQLAVNWSRVELEDWLAEKGVLAFVRDLPQGLDTLVGENGSQLSPGQRQQIICVRAILAKRSLYLFDEVTSSVDKDNEVAIYDLLNLVAQDALVIEITHKMKQVAKASQVLFIGKEKTVLGTPTEVYEQSEEYRQLANTQQELEELTYGN
ncbi:ABC transporter ATP-binding protein [Streptococcus sp. HMSC071H03]|uniref:ATP-binding cassette domain-containing protein n=2 Tax=Streptococcus anginosus TaxID=1328 RepID=A0AAP6BPQ8_STRAP|nr:MULTISPECIES: ATP-binding cassette domain-containing protein [Streptococcus]ALL02381.1 Putative ABC transporter, ATP-binding protein [Streptococcus anginosus]MDU6600673.1 ATP-binding cassette domain-containing protein [Streptococcus anginosus]MDX5040708.1 ATP-binding cassette domain-containing protein [Streptococcus anginosus]OFR45165.1 ABC transporter ATP-binding protein [Streptococcus sp. HMSC071H03]